MTCPTQYIPLTQMTTHYAYNYYQTSGYTAPSYSSPPPPPPPLPLLPSRRAPLPANH